MTDSERWDSILDRIRDVVGEHANGFVVAVQVDNDDDTTSTLITYKGGIDLALGLARRMQLKLEQVAQPQPTDPPDEEDSWKHA